MEPILGEGNFVVNAALYYDRLLKKAFTVDLTTEDTAFVGIELVDITNPNMVVAVDRFWLTAGTRNPEDSNYVNIISKDGTGCATVSPLLTEYPQPVPYNPSDPEWEIGRKKHPHLVFMIKPNTLGRAFHGANQLFIHYSTKVCVKNIENCFGTCNKNDRNSFVKPPEMPHIPTHDLKSSSVIMFKNYERSAGYTKKKFWDKIIDYNKEKIDFSRRNLRVNSIQHHENYINSSSNNQLQNDTEYNARLNYLISSFEAKIPSSNLTGHSRTRRESFNLRFNEVKVTYYKVFLT